MNDARAKELLQELHEDPEEFQERGAAYQLLQEFFEGYDIDTLRPLLRNKNALLRRPAVWIASELGVGCSGLIEEIEPLTNDSDRFIKMYALECLLLGSYERLFEKFALVVPALEDDDSVIRCHAMSLVGNASQKQIESAIELISKNQTNSPHLDGLSAMAAPIRESKEKALEMLGDSNPLTRRYGAILARRIIKDDAEPIRMAEKSQDEDISAFARSVIKNERLNAASQ